MYENSTARHCTKTKQTAKTLFGFKVKASLNESETRHVNQKHLSLETVCVCVQLIFSFISGLCLFSQMLVIFRNPKDTVVSFYHFSNKNPVLPSAVSWDSFYSDFMSGEGNDETCAYDE